MDRIVEHKTEIKKRTECWHCGADLLGKEFHAITVVSIYTSGVKRPKTIIKTIVEQACKQCSMMDEAIKEAEEHKNRFVMVGVGSFDSYFLNTRCACGKASYQGSSKKFNNGMCIDCSKVVYGLKREEAEIKLALKFAKNLSELIKENLYE